MKEPIKYLRVFFALDLPESIKEIIRRQISYLQEFCHQYQSQIRWVNAHNLHLTLQFLASVDSNHLNKMIEAVRAQLSEQTHFPVQLTEVSLFPTHYDPHIISLAVLPEATLTALSEKIGRAIEQCGYKTEKRLFRPHLTLGRIKTARHSIHLNDIKQTDIPVFMANEVVLYQSIPSSKDSHYTVLEKFNLK